LHNAAARLGAPGGSGGRETQAGGAATEGARLPSDIARAGLRRTTSIFTRFVPLVGGTWNEPPATTTGTFAGAVLQTVAAACETPELALLRTFNLVDPDDPNFPRTFNALLDRAKQWLTALVGQLGLPAGVASKANELITKVDELKDNTPNDESLQERIFYELLREVAASGWGRRDAQWALQGAFGQAQRFIYIETPGIAPTMAPTPPAGPAPGPFAANLFETLTARLRSTPSLHLIVCCPQQPDYPR